MLAQVGDLLDRLDALAQPDMRPAFERVWRALSEPAMPDRARRVAHLEKQAETARRRLADAAGLLVDGTLDREGYEALRDRERSALEAAEAELGRVQTAEANPHLPPLRFVLSQLGGWRRMLVGSDVPAQRDVLGLFVDHVRPEHTARGKYAAHITWTPLGQAVQAQDVAVAA